jgi:hypothetical protein
MIVIIEPEAYRKIYSFYLNTAKKWKYTWSVENAHEYIDKVCYEAENVMNLEQKNDSIIKAWVNYKVAYSKNVKWYFAYTIENNEIHVQDANHHQNMSNVAFQFKNQEQLNASKTYKKLRISERQLPLIIRHMVTEAINTHYKEKFRL